MAELRADMRDVDGVQTLSLHGELDSYSAPRVRALLESLTAVDRPTVVVHLAGLEYLDSSGLGVLVAGLKQASDRSGKLALSGVTEPVARVLRVTGLDQVFAIFADDALAREHLRGLTSPKTVL